MAPTTKKTSKPIFKTGLPFTATTAPAIGQKHQDVILELLCSLLEPLGQHRQNHVHPSKGKKRKRGHKQSSNDKTKSDGNPSFEVDDTSPPAPPELSNHILTGLNSVTRHLSTKAQSHAPATMPVSKSQESKIIAAETSNTESTSSSEQRPENEDHSMVDATEDEPNQIHVPLSIVIIPHPTPSASLPHSHIPTLVYLASMKTPQPTRLICLPSISEAKLAAALHIPRLSALGILEGAPGAKALEEYAREHVKTVECQWIEEAMKAEWQGVKTSEHKG